MEMCHPQALIFLLEPSTWTICSLISSWLWYQINAMHISNRQPSITSLLLNVAGFFLSQNQSANVYLYFKQNPLSITNWKRYFLNETLNWNSNFHSNSRKLTCEWLLSFRSLSRFVGLVYNKLATSFRDNRLSGWLCRVMKPSQQQPS